MKKLKYYIRSNYHDWSEVDRVTFEIYESKLKDLYARVSQSKVSEDEFKKRYTKTSPMEAEK